MKTVIVACLLNAGLVSATPIYFDGGGVGAAGGVAGGDGSSAASALDPDWAVNFGTSNPDADDVEVLTGFAGELVEVYKANQDGNTPTGDEEGAASGWYTVTFGPDASDPENATISWDGPGVITGVPLYLLAKDGNQGPSVLIWDITGWDGMMDLELVGLWPNQGAISHIAIYSGDRSVPDGGATVALLGASLLGLGVLRRKLAR